MAYFAIRASLHRFKGVTHFYERTSMKFKFSILLVLCCLFPSMARAADRPNILWIFQEDTSPWMGCYGSEVNKGWTSRVDKMASDGVMFTQAFVPFPVCSPCRSSMALGTNAIRFGAHEHRSRRGSNTIALPDGMKTISQLMHEAGYFAFNVGKTDYNFTEKDLYSNISKANNKTPWRERKAGQNFFG